MARTGHLLFGARKNISLVYGGKRKTENSSSTHNTRIERLWVEVGTQFVRRWRVFFQRLERLHSLDPNRPEHLWLLHFLFLDEINQDAADFQRVWNAHPIDGPQGGQKSPNVGRFFSNSF